VTDDDDFLLTVISFLYRHLRDIMKSIFAPSFVTLPVGLCKLSTPASV